MDSPGRCIIYRADSQRINYSNPIIEVDNGDRKIQQVFKNIADHIKQNFKNNFQKVWKPLFIFSAGVGFGTGGTLALIGASFGVLASIPVIGSIALAALAVFAGVLGTSFALTSLVCIVKGTIEGLMHKEIESIIISNYHSDMY